MTPDDAVVEAVADAIHNALGDGLEWSGAAEEAILAYRQAMRERGVVECPREPTEEMAKRFFANPDASFAVNYRAMLAAVESTDGKGE